MKDEGQYMKKNLQSLITLITTIIILSFLSCTDEITTPSHTNPFDPNNPETGGTAFHLTANITNGGISLEWTDPDFEDLRSFRIYRSEQEQSGYEIIIQLSSNTFSYLDTNIENGHSYWYKVTVLNISNNESGLSNAPTVNINTDPITGSIVGRNLPKVKL